jgi:hypothetical protein
LVLFLIPAALVLFLIPAVLEEGVWDRVLLLVCVCIPFYFSKELVITEEHSYFTCPCVMVMRDAMLARRLSAVCVCLRSIKGCYDKDYVQYFRNELTQCCCCSAVVELL